MAQALPQLSPDGTVEALYGALLAPLRLLRGDLDPVEQAGASHSRASTAS